MFRSGSHKSEYGGFQLFLYGEKIPRSKTQVQANIDIILEMASSATSRRAIALHLSLLSSSLIPRISPADFL